MSLTYYTIAEVLDYGPHITKVILEIGHRLKEAKLTPQHFSVSVERTSTCGKDFQWPVFMGAKPDDSMHGTRTVLRAYVSDQTGMENQDGTCITLELACSPTDGIGSIIRFDGDFNVFVNVHYTIVQKLPIDTYDGSLKGLIFDRNGGSRIIYGEWLLTGTFTFSDISLNYSYYIPEDTENPNNASQEKIPLIIWLHGAGEGGHQPLIAAIGNKVVNLISPEIQQYFGGKAMLLAPQSPTMWMNDGTGKYTVTGHSMYTEALEQLIQDFIDQHPAIDLKRIYIGGCSNGGFMTMKMLLRSPDRYAAAFPVCEALADAAISDADIQCLTHIPIWFTHAKNDPVVPPEQFVLPTYQRLIKAGARDVHFSFFDKVVDSSYKNPDGTPYEYLGHWSWIYMLNNACTLDFDGQPVKIEGKEVTIIEWLAAHQKSNNRVDLKGRPFFLSDEDCQWVYETLHSMTTEEKAGQLFCVNFKEGMDDEIQYIYSILSPGGCMYRPIPMERAIAFTNKVRKKARIPLLVAANLEKGGNGIVTEGTLMGSPMEAAACRSTDVCQKLALVCAREGLAVGANWAFAPIIDIDSNFRNPITNVRTFGSDWKLVRDYGAAYTKTVQAMGMAASIKHFPGDGQDERDQHLVTSINDLSCDDWDATYGQVYKACIDAGALTCMVGHIMQPAYSRYFNPDIKDEEIMPGSLSKELMQDLLRDKLGFNGLIVTDATTMAGYTIPMSRKRAVPESIARGADMFLFARNLKEDYAFMLQGIQDGIITQERLDEAVTRILAVKAALGLHKTERPLSLEHAKKVVGCREHQEWARECADKAITLVKEEPGVLPLTPEKYKRILYYPIESEGGFSIYKSVSGMGEKVMDMLRSRGFEVDTFVPNTGSEGRTLPTTAVTDQYDLIIYIANLATKSNQTAVRIEWAQPMGANCAHYVNDVPTIFISLENPYHLLDVPRIRTFINTYSSNHILLEELVKKLTGESEFKGISPVDPFCGKWDAHIGAKK